MSSFPPLDGIRVLVVDDVLEVREAVGDILMALGATVTLEGHAPDALETLIRERPDVLVSDISMPVHDGFWLITAVRALAERDGGATPAAALTGNVSAEARAAVLRAGFQYHVPKPFDPKHLAGVIALLALKP